MQGPDDQLVLTDGQRAHNRRLYGSRIAGRGIDREDRRRRAARIARHASVARRLGGCARRGLLAAPVAAARPRQQFRAGVDLVRAAGGRHRPRRAARARADAPTTSRSSRTASRRRSRTFAEGAPGEAHAAPPRAAARQEREHGAATCARPPTPRSSSSTRSTKPSTSRSSTSTRTIRVGRFAPPSYPQLFERIRDRKADGMTRRCTTRSASYLEATLERGRPARAAALHRRRRLAPAG